VWVAARGPAHPDHSEEIENAALHLDGQPGVEYICQIFFIF
jgi:hypothetical protein